MNDQDQTRTEEALAAVPAPVEAVSAQVKLC